MRRGAGERIVALARAPDPLGPADERSL